MIFRVEQGSFRYDKKTARPLLREINFSVNPGEVVAILGPNGAGKTTLLRCMLGFLPWDSGASLLDDVDIRTMSPRELWRQIAYVPQARGAIGGLSVEETVLLGRGSHFGVFSQPGAEDIRLARESLERLNIAHLAQRQAAQLSGGELQMVLIARALAAQPGLLVLDEPESNLDFKNQLIILDAISDLAADGIACVFNTHYPTHALQRADHALLLDKQGNCTFGTAQAVIDPPHIASAFGVSALISEVETKHNIYKNVVPLQVLTIDAENSLQQVQPAPVVTEEETMENETRLAIIGIIIEDRSCAERINTLLSTYGGYIVGRMGMPYEKKNLSIITVIIDAPEDIISTLSGKLGMLRGVNVKTTYSKR